MPEFSGTIISLFKKRAVSEQGGLLSGNDPTEVNTQDPLRLWIIQVGLIVGTASLLSLALKKVRQPKVIAEVLGGIILGPTAFGRIPGFTEHIFPQDSRPYLSLTANIGLCLFLFLVGLEIEASVIKRNAKLSTAVAFAGMALPFGLGAALSIPIYHHFIPPTVHFTDFMLFTGVAYSITAFPVLCRILTELKLLDTTVGIVVLSAGVGNDIVGWTLLALSIALVNAGSGLMALWILLTCVGWTLFLLFPVKFVLHWLAKKTGSIESGPTVFFMTVTMMTMLGSAFFTDVIGVHAIFGAFVTGLIIPREGGLTIALTEKLEDMVAIIFLPLYFTISGLSTDLGLLNDGITWGFTISIMCLAFSGKFGGCTLAAHYVAGFNWRESATIGSLMSCKGLVELIVLNVGLSANILTQRVFSMFVLEALVLTCMTTPLVVTLYPPKYRVRIAKTGANFNNVADDEDAAANAEGAKRKKRSRRLQEKRPSQSQNGARDGYEEPDEKTRFTVILDKLEHLPGAMAVTQLIITGGRLSPAPSETSSTSSSNSSSFMGPSPIINALRLIKLTDRTSAVMKVQDSFTLLNSDPLLSIYRMFALLQGIDVFGDVDVVSEDVMATSAIEKADSFGAEMVIVPWAMGPSTNILADGWQTQPHTPKGNVTHNPFDTLFGKSAAKDGTNTPAAPEGHSHHSHGLGFWSFPSTAVMHSHFIRNVFARSDVDVGLYIDRSISNPLNLPLGLNAGGRGRGRVHLLLPFIGGPDDRLALEFVVELCRRNERLRATVVRLRKAEEIAEPVLVGADGTIPGAEGGDKDKGLEVRNEEANMMTITSGVPNFPDTVYGQPTTEVVMQSETADNIVWARYTTLRPTFPRNDSGSSSASAPPPVALTPVAPRVMFKDITTAKPLHAALDEAHALQRLSISRSRKGFRSSLNAAGVGVVVVAGRSRRLAVESHRAELKELMAEDASTGVEVVENSMVREVRKTVGEVGSAFVGRGVGVGIWILQASLDQDK
ncbi:K(+)/H(+) antiporter 1 [Leucoagaricus sp. SymC.cos]|nr:K(+)/H(+) antiporter 1 [Leucoagaricus sp. SymC.cos]